MKVSSLLFAAATLLCCAISAYPQAAFDVISLDGSAKVQRSTKKEFEKVSLGSQIHDNDIVETYFQAKLVMQFGKGNVAILGSNSKALVNIREQKADNGSVSWEVNLTLFGGGCFVKAISNCKISVYTSNGVGETDNGSFSTVVEPKTGETGFQNLGGTIQTRNIAQKEGSVLSSGQTTMIFPGKEPTAPLYITVRHVTVLKHFFGDDYIDAELGAAGIKPTEETGIGGGQTSAESKGSQMYNGTGGQAGYKPRFNEDKIWGSIIADQKKSERVYEPMPAPDVSKEHAIVIQEINLFAMANGKMFPSFALVPSYSSKAFSAGLRIPFTANWTGALSLYDFSSPAGFLDIIDHVTIGPFFDSTFIKLGPLRNFTIGGGLVVDEYDNYNPYLIFHPLGVLVQTQLGDLNVKGFAGDLTSFSPGGIYLCFDPGTIRIGAGYFFDGNINYLKTADSAGTGFRFVKLPRPDSSPVLMDSAATSNVYQVDITAEIFSTSDYLINLGAGFAQKLAATHTDGFVLRAPDLEIRWNAMRLDANITTEAGRLIEGQFNSFYMSNRARIIDTAAIRDTLITQNSILSPRRMGSKIELTFDVNPLKGMLLGFTYRQNIFENYPMLFDSNYTDPDLAFGVFFSVNDNLVKPLKYASVRLEETHGGMYPRNTVFPSWGFHAGVEAMTNPILLGLGLCGGFSWYYLDMNSNGQLDAADNVLEFYVGLRYGFL